MIGGKAAPGYYNAKVIIELINRVGTIVNSDKDIGDLLKVVFLPNYNVSSAQIIIPASELSQHISTAGTEASGTSNMKFVMNGGLIIGTMDGANVEIAQEIGEENMFIFGKNVPEVTQARKEMYEEGRRDYVGSRLGRVYETIKCGTFGGNTQAFINLIDSLINGGDHYLVSHDFYSYLEAQAKVDLTYRDQKKWNEMAILGVAKSGFFSSDRTISEYASQIWNLDSVPIPQPTKDPKARVRSYANMPIE
jgi:glycogen phosphorylase